MKKNTEEVHSRALNVSHVGNEILKFNRVINRVFHSHRFSVGHGKLLCFSLNSPLLLAFRTNKPRISHRRKVKLRSGGAIHGRAQARSTGTRVLSRSRRANEHTNERTHVVSACNSKERWVSAAMERRENFGHLWCLY